MRTEQDKINRKEANQRYYKLKENKETKCNYQIKYDLGLRGPKHTQPAIYPYHEEWAKENGYRYNDQLNSKNTVSFKDGAER